MTSATATTRGSAASRVPTAAAPAGPAPAARRRWRLPVLRCRIRRRMWGVVPKELVLAVREVAVRAVGAVRAAGREPVLAEPRAVADRGAGGGWGGAGP